jgi:hypothetical protein
MNNIFDIPENNNFQEIPFLKRTSLVLYHGEHCPYCVQPREEWKGVVDNFSDEEINIVKIESNQIPEGHNISALPTIILFDENNNKYEFPRNIKMTQENIVDFVEKNKSIKSKSIKSKSIKSKSKKSKSKKSKSKKSKSKKSKSKKRIEKI